MPRRIDLTRAWAWLWYRPAAARNLAAARVILAGTALWVVLSRPDLPSLLGFPSEVWAGVWLERKLRFLLVFGPGVERALWTLVHVTLGAAVLGIAPRAACFASGLLLYHFAPLETLIRTGNPYLRGLTIPTLGLLVLSFAPRVDALTLWPRRRPDAPTPVPELRWPLTLVQLLICQVYFFAGYAKLFTSGLGWASAANIRGHLLVLNQLVSAAPAQSAGYAVAQWPLACAAIAWGGLGFELAFPLVLVSALLRRLFLPLAVVFHVLNAWLFGILFQDLPLLLVFVDWDGLRGRVAWTG